MWSDFFAISVNVGEAYLWIRDMIGIIATSLWSLS